MASENCVLIPTKKHFIWSFVVSMCLNVWIIPAWSQRYPFYFYKNKLNICGIILWVNVTVSKLIVSKKKTIRMLLLFKIYFVNMYYLCKYIWKFFVFLAYQNNKLIVISDSSVFILLQGWECVIAGEPCNFINMRRRMNALESAAVCENSDYEGCVWCVPQTDRQIEGRVWCVSEWTHAWMTELGLYCRWWL